MFGEQFTEDSYPPQSDVAPHLPLHTQEIQPKPQTTSTFESLMVETDANVTEIMPASGPVNILYTHHMDSFYRIHDVVAEYFGAYIDTGAEHSVFGKAQAGAYCSASGQPFVFRPSYIAFQFSVGHQIRSGTIAIPIPIGNGFIDISLDVVAPNFPLLIGVDIIENFERTVDASRNKMTNAHKSWTAPL